MQTPILTLSMKRTIALACLITLVALTALLLARRPGVVSTKDQSSIAQTVSPDRLKEVYGNLQLSFEANQGQVDAAVQYLARGVRVTVCSSLQARRCSH